MKRKILTASLLVIAGLLSLALRENSEFTRNGTAMNTLIRMTVYGQNESVLDDSFALLSSLDKRLSMYDPSSDISIINKNSGVREVPASPETIETIKDSVRLYEITGGVFNPLIGAVTKLWKINRPEGKLPSQESLDIAVKLSGIQNLTVSEGNVFLKEKGCVLDLGGIAKGYASTKISRLMKDKGVKSAIIDLGGNVHTVGSKPDGSSWRVGIRNPLETFGSPAVIVEVKDCAVITSGNYERYRTVDGKKYSHFFDSLTGRSIMSDLLSVTVISEDGSLADGLATAFMITGVDKALEILRKMENPPRVIFITHSGISATSNAKDNIIRSLIPVSFHSLH